MPVKMYGDRTYDGALMDHARATQAIEDAALLRRLLAAIVRASGGVVVLTQLEFAATGGAPVQLHVSEDPASRTLIVATR